jgi:hypothetical protein
VLEGQEDATEDVETLRHRASFPCARGRTSLPPDWVAYRAVADPPRAATPRQQIRTTHSAASRPTIGGRRCCARSAPRPSSRRWRCASATRARVKAFECLHVTEEHGLERDNVLVVRLHSGDSSDPRRQGRIILLGSAGRRRPLGWVKPTRLRAAADGCSPGNTREAVPSRSIPLTYASVESGPRRPNLGPGLSRRRL